jgi:hypothetical protein
MAKRPRGAAKDVGDLLRELEKQGFHWELTRKCHYRVFSPDGTIATTIGNSSGNWRSLLNSLSWLRKAGFKRPR